MKNGEERIIPTMGVNNCGGRCIIKAHVKDGEVVRITTDTSEGTLENPPLTACAKGLNYHKTYLNPEKRLLTPLLRTGKRGEGKFRQASWEEAVDYICKEWVRIRDTYGVGSRYVHYGWGVSALVTPLQLMKRLLALDGGFLDYYNSYSTACINYTTPYLFGTKQVGNSYRDLVNSKLIILWGHNPAETRFDHMMYYLKEAKKRGIPILCVDPRYHDTARLLGAEWIGIRPATDSALMDAMAYVMITKSLYDEHFIKTYCQGFTADTMPKGYEEAEDYFSYVLGKRDGVEKTPTWAEKITGVSAAKIRELAIRYATTKPAALIQGYGPQRNRNGEQTIRGSVALACLTGNVGISGGWAGASVCQPGPVYPSMPTVENPYKRTIPVYTWTDELRAGKLKMIFNLAGNALLNQHGDIGATAKLLEDTSLCECIVCSDVFMTPSAKYADVILPAVSFLEMNNMVTPWEVGNFIGAVNKVAEPLGQCRFEYDWMKEIARRIGVYDAFTEGHETVEEWLRDRYEAIRPQVPDLPKYEEFVREGIYRYPVGKPHVAFQEQIERPGTCPFPTPSGKIEIFSPALYELGNHKEIPGIPGYLPVSEGPEDELYGKYPLQLVGYHTKRRCHSIHDTNEELEKLDPQRVHIHVEDATARGIKDGDMVRVYNDRGTCILPAKVTEHVAIGVVAMAQGAWHTPDEKGLDRRGSINNLTSLETTPLAKGNAQHTNLVEIELYC